MKTESETKHTPGPWQQSEDIKAAVNGVFQGVWIKQGHMTLADVFTDIPEGVANARLIAAAPDMLAALEESIYALREMAAEYEPGANSIGRLNRARAAIAKAKGETA